MRIYLYSWLLFSSQFLWLSFIPILLAGAKSMEMTLSRVAPGFHETWVSQITWRPLLSPASWGLISLELWSGTLWWATSALTCPVLTLGGPLVGSTAGVTLQNLDSSPSRSFPSCWPTTSLRALSFPTSCGRYVREAANHAHAHTPKAWPLLTLHFYLKLPYPFAFVWHYQRLLLECRGVMMTMAVTRSYSDFCIYSCLCVITPTALREPSGLVCLSRLSLSLSLSSLGSALSQHGDCTHTVSHKMLLILSFPIPLPLCHALLLPASASDAFHLLNLQGASPL